MGATLAHFDWIPFMLGLKLLGLKQLLGQTKGLMKLQFWRYFSAFNLYFFIFWPAAPVGTGTNDSGHATGCELNAFYLLYSRITDLTFQDTFMVPWSTWGRQTFHKPSFSHFVRPLLVFWTIKFIPYISPPLTKDLPLQTWRLWWIEQLFPHYFSKIN